MLLEVAGEDLPSLAAEVSKLASAVTGRAVTSADVEELAGVRHGETVADFVAAVMGRRFADAANMVGVLLSSPGASGVKLVTALGSSLSGLLLARSLLDSGMAAPAAEGRVLAALQFARPAGLGDWRAAAAQWVRDAQGWSAGELEQAASQLLRADKRLKASGLAGEEEVVREAVLSLGAARVAA
jgi:DNA polymerase III delta subunit